ncbi:MAG: DNA-3-methyladenine glycosylase 2 family protein [Thaumarchaeota archaeon]|nr:DNA-3-methyladenine glycosylase 2 family protein [Nitrososphaerota archaeon]
MHSRSGTLETVAPFEFQRSLEFIQRFRPLAGEQHVGEGALTKAIMVDGKPVVFRVTGTAENGLHYELFSKEAIPDPTTKSMAERISFFLSLGDDIRPFYEIAEKDPQFYPKVQEFWGLHHVKFPSLLEISCWAILAQRVQRPIAQRAKQAIIEKFGASIELEGKTYWAFPDYERLRRATPSQLRLATRNQRTAERLDSLLTNFQELDETFLKTALYEKAEERLRRVKGIGEWSAQFILFRGLGRVERLQYSMKPVLKMMEAVYGPGKTLDEINRQYGTWSGYWSLYLWGSKMASRSEEEEGEEGSSSAPPAGR